jgi:uncharacterized membrane protein YgaE (UPF0421/DUF939 family)
MEQLLFILLGAFVAIGGSFLAQRNQLILNSREHDQKLLIQISECLCEYASILEKLSFSKSKTPTLDVLSELHSLEIQKGKLHESLMFLAVKMNSKKYRTISVQLTKFSLHEELRTTENLDELARCTYLLTNGKMIDQYEKEIEESPLKMKKII